MAEITAALVKELRDKTNAGMLDCKKALTETGGDLEAAVDLLRKKGLAAAAKKAGRVAAEGLIGVLVEGNRGVLVEVNAETDFVARNESFQEFTRKLLPIALACGGDVDKMLAAPYPDGGTVAEKQTALIATIGENLGLRRANVVAVDQGVVASYVHNSLAPGLGKIGVLVALRSAAPSDQLMGLGKQLAMQVAAATPDAVNIADVDPAKLERERAILAEQAAASGRPANVIEKMVEGRLRKYYEDVVLLEQVFVVDGESKVKDVIAKAAKDCGGAIEVAAFKRMTLGEGIERKVSDLAAEVAAQLGG